MKNKSVDKSDLIKILHDLSKQEKYERVQLKALELSSLLVPEEEFRKENNTEQVTGLFVKNFNAACQGGKSHKADAILNGFKGIEFIEFSLLKCS